MPGDGLLKLPNYKITQLQNAPHPCVSGMLCGGTAADHILNIHRGGRDSHHLVAPVDNFAFAGNENSSPLERKAFFGSPG